MNYRRQNVSRPRTSNSHDCVSGTDGAEEELECADLVTAAVGSVEIVALDPDVAVSGELRQQLDA